MKFLTIKNQTALALAEIPVLSYHEFCIEVDLLISIQTNRCSLYYAFPFETGIKFICILADDANATFILLSHHTENKDVSLISLTAKHFQFHIFEREIAENYDVKFVHHPWDKPVRYAFDRVDQTKTIANYPFFQITGNQIHEVGVGPIHAGVIEPGHFRFQCMGEEVLHLEIQLGYQHRGIEKLMLQKQKPIQQHVLVESVAGDSTVAHTYTYVRNIELLQGYEPDLRLELIRTIALELERVAIHLGDLSALCLDMAYQLGNPVFGALRTPVINYFQLWCGNRFARTLLRVGSNPYPLNKSLVEKLIAVIEDVEMKYIQMADEMFDDSTVLMRLERTGIVTKQQMQLIGAVGIPARAVGLYRDLRFTHPFAYYTQFHYEPFVKKEGDVLSHAKIRDKELRASMQMILKLAKTLETFPLPEPNQKALPKVYNDLKKSHIVISATEGWRGETMHVAITNEVGTLAHYKFKDPSMHNWLALALAVRNNEIADFPICNKTFDLSYCGHDL